MKTVIEFRFCDGNKRYRVSVTLAVPIDQVLRGTPSGSVRLEDGDYSRCELVKVEAA